MKVLFPFWFFCCACRLSGMLVSCQRPVGRTRNHINDTNG